ncbi:ATP-dependent Clp protease proteolytic subunit [Myroides sp. JBRI-B21084]|uniref:ATP-dependent Clp protease proteolytic subunit n=1 Tax=Myroides sp. JBRI-B21084 TaxID=3119977 RepID=UPI0026E281B3|nr:ATP-dependent Clp protease proteolytic subunit [Paenimyroides cloacae]WKW46724.1 ATP-dependent Clp protease proteolytic subunit [Paenimyroides cloacae]
MSRIEVTAINENSKEYLIKITDEIIVGSSDIIRQITDDLIFKGTKDVQVYINSRGGNVFEASEIVNQLKRFNNVTLLIGSVSASASTYIMAHFKSKAFKSSQFMIHSPKMTTSGDYITIENDLKLLKNITLDYVNAYASKLNKSNVEIEAMFKNGDNWFNSDEALQIGLLDEIIENSTLDNKTEVKALVSDVKVDYWQQITSKWTFEDWAEKDPEGLKNMMVNDPKRFEAISTAYYGK